MPTTPQKQYAISGTVTLGGSNYHGGQIWIRGLRDGKIPAPVDDITYIYTNAKGQYLINVANNTTAWEDGDTVRVWCKVGNMIKYTDVNIDQTLPGLTVDFAFTRASALVDGCKGSALATQKGGLRSDATVKGCKDELQ